MTIVTIQVKDITNPIEVQTWFNANNTVNIAAGFIQGDLFYIITNP